MQVSNTGTSCPDPEVGSGSNSAPPKVGVSGYLDAVSGLQVPLMCGF